MRAGNVFFDIKGRKRESLLLVKKTKERATKRERERMKKRK